jgi:hypothetical protein
VDAASRDNAIKLLLSNPTAPATPLWADLHGLAFVPNASGALCKASELYDSRKPHVVALVDHDDSFPAAQFANSDQVGGHPGVSSLDFDASCDNSDCWSLCAPHWSGQPLRPLRQSLTGASCLACATSLNTLEPLSALFSHVLPIVQGLFGTHRTTATSTECTAPGPVQEFAN